MDTFVNKSINQYVLNISLNIVQTWWKHAIIKLYIYENLTSGESFPLTNVPLQLSPWTFGHLAIVASHLYHLKKITPINYYCPHSKLFTGGATCANSRAYYRTDTLQKRKYL